MTVKDLINLLQSFPQDAIVVDSYSYMFEEDNFILKKEINVLEIETA